LLDAGPLQDYLGTVKSWVDGHPNDVVTLLITNEDAIDINKFADAFKAVGLDSYTFIPSAQLGFDEWPTLGDLISSGNRVIVFMGELVPISLLVLVGKSVNTAESRLPLRHEQGPVYPG
jgi:hypothetical protein